mgnify:CR=1 FL=1
MIRNDVAITPELVKEHGLKPDEYERFVKLIGREPTITELGIVSAMWNEHCSYKSSRIHLRGLPTKAPWVIQGPGENAGVIDIGDGLACIFKMESHNHPSYIEPYQGAATGEPGQPLVAESASQARTRCMREVGTWGWGPLGPPGIWRTMGEGCGLRVSSERAGDEAGARPCMRARVAPGWGRKRGVFARCCRPLRAGAIAAP